MLKSKLSGCDALCTLAKISVEFFTIYPKTIDACFLLYTRTLLTVVFLY